MVVSDADILALPPKEKPYKQFFGEGLFVVVQPDGKKYWRLKYRFCRREQTYAMGVFPEVSFADAMVLKKAAKDLLGQGLNPNAIKQQEAKRKERENPKNIFRLALNPNGALTVETNTKLLKLTPSQTNALWCFLGAEPELHGGGDVA